MVARTGRPYKLQVLSTNGERKLQGSANNPTITTITAVASGTKTTINLYSHSHHSHHNNSSAARIVALAANAVFAGNLTLWVNAAITRRK